MRDGDIIYSSIDTSIFTWPPITLFLFPCSCSFFASTGNGPQKLQENPWKHCKRGERSGGGENLPPLHDRTAVQDGLLIAVKNLSGWRKKPAPLRHCVPGEQHFWGPCIGYLRHWQYIFQKWWMNSSFVTKRVYYLLRTLHFLKRRRGVYIFHLREAQFRSIEFLPVNHQLLLNFRLTLATATNTREVRFENRNIIQNVNIRKSNYMNFRKIL